MVKKRVFALTSKIYVENIFTSQIFNMWYIQDFLSHIVHSIPLRIQFSIFIKKLNNQFIYFWGDEIQITNSEYIHNCWVFAFAHTRPENFIPPNLQPLIPSRIIIIPWFMYSCTDPSILGYQMRSFSSSSA